MLLCAEDSGILTSYLTQKTSPEAPQPYWMIDTMHGETEQKNFALSAARILVRLHAAKESVLVISAISADALHHPHMQSVAAMLFEQVVSDIRQRPGRHAETLHSLLHLSTTMSADKYAMLTKQFDVLQVAALFENHKNDSLTKNLARYVISLKKDLAKMYPREFLPSLFRSIMSANGGEHISLVLRQASLGVLECIGPDIISECIRGMEASTASRLSIPLLERLNAHSHTWCSEDTITHVCTFAMRRENREELINFLRSGNHHAFTALGEDRLETLRNSLFSGYDDHTL